MLTEQQLARLANRAARIRWPFSGRGRRARDQLRHAAVAGDLAAARTLAAVDRNLVDAMWHAVPPLKRVSADVVRAITAIVVDPDPEVLTSEMRAGLTTAATDANHVVTLHRSISRIHLDRWRVTGDSLTKTATSEAALPAVPVQALYGDYLGSLPSHRQRLRDDAFLMHVAGVLVVHRWVGKAELLDSQSLQEAGDGAAWIASSLPPPSALVAPSGEHGFVVADSNGPYLDRRLQVHDARRPGVVDMLDRPIETLNASDLRTVAALDDVLHDPCVRLLHTLLVRRFGTDVRLGANIGSTPAAADIALGGRTQ